MDDLSKQQLILLALLVSFVTSLATGIVTVSLMDQAPQGVTRTVSQVIEKTIQQIAPQSATVNDAGSDAADATAQTVSRVEQSIVRLGNKSGTSFGGLGLVVSKAGVILTDKAAIAGLTEYVALMADGTPVPVIVIQSQNEGDIVFLVPIGGAGAAHAAFIPIDFAAAPELGQTVFSLTGSTTLSLGQGIITEDAASDVSSSNARPIRTSVPLVRVEDGSPLFDMRGGVIGMRISSLGGPEGAEFYPLSQLKSVIPQIK